MLVLSRHVNESIVIPLNDLLALANRIEGEVVEIKVIATKGETARIGVSAPRCLEVHREEVYERILADMKSEQELTPAA